jgi:hypothetical protein
MCVPPEFGVGFQVASIDATLLRPLHQLRGIRHFRNGVGCGVGVQHGPIAQHLISYKRYSCCLSPPKQNS